MHPRTRIVWVHPSGMRIPNNPGNL